MSNTSSTSMTQTQKIHNYLRGTGRALTAEQALSKWNVRNLPARMSELRQLGLRVNTQINDQGQTEYTISARDQQGSRSKMIFAKL